MTALLEVQSLSLCFGGVQAVDDVSFAVRPNEVFALIGPNGAGKTSIFNLISAIYRPTGGRVVFAGEAVSHLAPHEIARLGIARTFQNIELFEHASVLANLLIGCHCRRHSAWWQDLLLTPRVRRTELQFRRQAEEVIDFLDLQHYRDSPVASLPYGVRKVVELGRALAMRPRLLLLDEPSSGLNAEETGDMAYWIEDIKNDLGITVLMVEHDMGLVSRVADRVLALNQGRVMALGSPAAVQSDPAVIDAYIGGGR